MFETLHFRTRAHDYFGESNWITRNVPCGTYRVHTGSALYGAPRLSLGRHCRHVEIPIAVLGWKREHRDGPVDQSVSGRFQLFLSRFRLGCERTTRKRQCAQKRGFDEKRTRDGTGHDKFLTSAASRV